VVFSSIALQPFLFAVGLVILYYGAEWLIESASSIALHYGIRRVVVGLTIVALGTSMPEFVVNAFAVFEQESELALGNILGSNICNIALILGASAVVLPLAVTPQMLRKEYPMMMGAMVVFYLLAIDGLIGTLDGVVLVSLLVGVMAFLFYDAQRTESQIMLDELSEAEGPTDPEPTWKRALYLVAGIAFLAGGANLMVESAVQMANYAGVDHAVVGLTVVAIGTSLPELAASMVGAMNDEADLSVGNVLGSNLLNVLFVVGTVALFNPLSVQTKSITLYFPIMLGFCVLFFPLAWTENRISRWEGALLLTGFVGYMTFLVYPYL
jgi:cation:H+ antiporter